MLTMPTRPSDVIIAVMGVTGVGKTSFISLFTEEDLVIGHSLEACKAHVYDPLLEPNPLMERLGTSVVGIHEGSDVIPGRRLFLIDTPGFDDTYKSDTEILREVANWLSQAYENKVQLSGIIYLHRILDTRLGGSAMKNLRMFKKLCGESSLASVVLATTMWDDVDEETGNNREQELKTNPRFWAGMIANGSTVFKHDRQIASAMDIISHLIQKKRPIDTDIAKEMVDNNKTLDQTSAGIEVTTEIAEQKKRFEKELNNIKKDMEEAMAKRDREWHAELEREKRDTLKKLKKEEVEREKMRVDWEKLKQEKDEELVRERENLATQLMESRERMLKHEHEITLMKLRHENSATLQRKEFELERLRAAHHRQSKQEEDSSGCVVM